MLAEANDYSDDMGEIVLVDPTRDALLAIAKSTCLSLHNQSTACYLRSIHTINGERYNLLSKVSQNGNYYAEASLSHSVDCDGNVYEGCFMDEDSKYVFTDSELK